MVKDQEISKILYELNHKAIAEFALAGNDVQVRAIDQSSKLSFTTTIYQGSTYIPKSIRNSLENKVNPSFQSGSIPTYVRVNEDDFRITLHYLGNLEIHPNDLKELLEEFSMIANEWRMKLDDLDNNDRVYIYNKRS